MMSGEDVVYFRSALAAAIEKGSDSSEAVLGLLYAEVPFSAKFQVLNFCDLLENNAQSAATLKRLIQALSILEKYARHLMKPAESRSNMWRHIKYSNSIFRERVDSVKGGKYVMYLMGYSENRPDGVAFPDGVEPNHERILNLLTDLVLGRKELELYLERQHPKPADIEQYMTQHLRASLEGEIVIPEDTMPGSQHEVPGVIPSSTSAFAQYQQSPGLPAGSIQAANNQLPQFSQLTSQSLGSRQPTTGSDNTQMSQYVEPNLLTRQEVNQHYPAANQLPQRMPNYDHETYVQNVLPRQNSGLQGQGQIAGIKSQGQFAGVAHQGQLPSINRQGQGQVAAMAHHGQGQVAGIAQQAQGQFAGMASQGHSEFSSINRHGQGQHAGMNQQGVGLEVSTNQQYLERQHRPNDVEQKAQTVESPKELEGKTPSIACDICGDNHAVVICRMCDNKQLCEGCDIKWHNHPKRQNHSLEYLQASAMPHRGEQQNTSYGMQGVAGGSPLSMYTMQRDPAQQGQLGYTSQSTIPGQQMNQTQQSPNLDLRQGQYNVKTSQYNMMGHSSNIAPPSPAQSEQLNTHMPNSFVYPQPNMMGMPGTMHYPVSSGMMQHGQHVPYVSPPMIQGPVAQYPVSYIPSMYMHQQPQPQHMSMHGYLTPVGSAGAHMQRQQNLRASTLPRSASAQSSAAPVVVQNVRHSISSPRVSEPPSIPGTSPGSASSTSSESELLPGILNISNLEKRQSRLQICIMTLKDDLREWEEKINAIILQNPNFFQDEEYKNLSRKKRKHLQEIRELQKYHVELEKLLSEKVEREKMEENEKREVEVETLRKRFNQIKTSESHDQPVIPVTQIPSQPEQPLYENFVLPVSKEEGTSQNVSASATSGPSVPTGLVPAGPVTTTYRPQQLQKQLQTPAIQGLTDDACPPLYLNSLGDDLPEDIKKMLVLDQSPFAPAPGILNDNARNSGQAVGAENVLFPPKVVNAQGVSQRTLNDKTGFKKGNSEPDLQGQVAQQKMQIKKSQSSTDLPMWQCEHCTFLNDYSEKACTMCYKTTDNPKRIEPKIPAVTEEPPGGDNTGKPCEFCTVLMEPGTRVCTVCGKTQTEYQNQKPVANLNPATERQNAQEEALNQSVERKQRGENQSVADATEAMANATAASTVGKLIEEEQDQVYLEKKAARERFEKLNRSPRESTPKGAEMSATSYEVQEGAVGTKYDVEPLKQDVVQEWVVVDKTHKDQTGQGKPIQAESTASNKDIERLRKTSSGSASSYNSAASSLDETVEPKVKAANQVAATVEPKVKAAIQVAATGKATKAPPQLNFVEAIEQINLKREQEQMSLDGHEVMVILKEGERLGYEVDEVQIALKHSVEDKLRPLDWLKSKWSDLIDIVATMATEKGKTADQNNVGDVSDLEAKRALIECGGEIDKAVEKCVGKRNAKYAEICKSGQYAREVVLTALYQNHGDVEEAVDQLNHSVVQSYTDRLWDTNENRGGDAVIAAAARSAELGNSVSNSVINHTEFQRLVSDTTIDKDRRVRMVFVEGKLKSWGRAEMVVTILDKEVTLSATPLECTLEDIIEAVRNCGDRRSSLVYLTQECGVCFSKYPMSKIRDLGVCNCKLCQSCVKQYFEVAIREHYVRNWCCPLCDAPGIVDDAKTTSYFEFLSLILQSLVSREVMELYEIKLRDWHLQKDPNFRWCAHCASGFIWDRPDVLGMACPSCHQKTCFMCKIKWEDQHEGLTCAEFDQWKIDNDPEKQAKGVKLYLEENGIDCPSCKMRYSLAKGGCMHFKCPQCGYEFCSGCSHAFLHQETCKLLKSCKGKGLHCHHPRDCFYYLRDSDPAELERLLKDNKIVYNTEVPVTQEDRNHCPVMEQKEYGPQKKDEPCGKDTKKGMAGLCEDHFKEYLVGLINRNKIDPITMMSLQQMKILIERNEKEMPKRNQTEAEGQYRKRVMQFIKERWQLNR